MASPTVSELSERASAVQVDQPTVVPALRHVPRVGVVLAAGRSSRIEGLTGGGSKALVRLGGMFLVERAVRTLLAAGVERVLVVVGYSAGAVASVVVRFNPEHVSTVYAHDWELGNGASLAAVRQSVEGEDLFALITTDHVFGDSSLDGLLNLGEAAVLVDAGPDQAAWSEGTRVRIRDGVALRFGKKISHPAIDCGAFTLPPEIFKFQRMAADKGDHSLAGALTRLARAMQLKAVTIPTLSWWLDIDTPGDFKQARLSLRRSLAKRSDGYVARFLNRPISTRLSMAIASLRLSPNLLSLVSFLVAVLGAWLIAGEAAIVGGILAQTASVLDGVDGEIARLSVKVSPRGALLDGILDRFADAAILAALGLMGGAGIVLTSAAITGALMSMSSKDRIAALGLQAPVLPTDRLAGRDSRLLIASLGALLGYPAIALAIVAATSLVALAVRMLFVRPPRIEHQARL